MPAGDWLYPNNGCCGCWTVPYTVTVDTSACEIAKLKARVAELEAKAPPPSATPGEVIAALATSPFATSTLAEYIDKAIADEREACAKLAEENGLHYHAHSVRTRK